MRVKKAVIPAAGLGTRVLPASKAMPKEMLPIVDKPAIQYIVEEAVKAGIEDILIITNRGKTTVEDHFDRAPELEAKLLQSGKNHAYRQVVDISRLANIQYIRQKETKGLGHAIYCAKAFVGNEPFAVLYGDDVVIGQTPAIKQLCDAYEKYETGIVGIKEVPTDQIMKYCTLQVEKLEDKIYKVTDMIEKPNITQIMSDFAILGRCVLPPEIFDILETIPAGANGEIQLTDAMRKLCLQTPMIGVDYDGTRYDMGNKMGIMKAIVEVGLSHAEVGEEFKQYLLKKAKELKK